HGEHQCRDDEQHGQRVGEALAEVGDHAADFLRVPGDGLFTPCRSAKRTFFGLANDSSSRFFSLQR
ncbi:MAG TPA: hypothetical protein VEA40_08165, partial [Ramlibacter sp.]|nr:hypothetical protein [Ramlibacter sp.]